LVNQQRIEAEANKRYRELQNSNKKIDDQYALDLDRVSKLMESMRIEKDEEIKRITILIER